MAKSVNTFRSGMGRYCQLVFLFGWEFLCLLFWASPTLFDVLLLCTGTFFALAGGTTYPALGILFGKLIDDLNSSTCDIEDEPSFAAIKTKVLLIAAVAIVQFLVIYLYMGCWTFFGERLVRRLRVRYLTALLRQDAAYFETLPPGFISSRLDSDIRAIQDGTSEKVAVVLTSISYFMAAYSLSFYLNPKLAALMFLMVPAYLLVSAACSHFLTKYGQEASTLTDRAISIASEGLSNIRLVKAFRAQYRLEVIFANYLQKAQHYASRKSFTEALHLGSMFLVSYAANALAIWKGSRDIADSVSHASSGITAGTVYTVIFVLVDASFVITRVAPLFRIFAGAVSASRNLSQVIERRPVVKHVYDATDSTISTTENEIFFKAVTFHYPSRPQQAVLHQITIGIPKGQMTAIVGLSGSGKSTIASLIARIYDVDAGQILIRGRDVRTLDSQHLRNLISVVDQGSSLLECSVLENVAFGVLGSSRYRRLHNVILRGKIHEVAKTVRDGASLEEAVSGDQLLSEVIYLVQRATDLAEASSFIKTLPSGLATHVGHKGGQFSGGQMQRICLARAFVKDSPILVLDEATAALDSRTEKAIQATIEATCRGKTVICIAHRLSTIQNADKVIVMGEGRALEEGSYSTLMQRDGSFAAMVRLQEIDLPSRASTSKETSVQSSPLPLPQADHISAMSSPELTSMNELLEDPAETTPLLGSRLVNLSVTPSATKPSTFHVFLRVLNLARSQRRYLVIGAIAATLAGTTSPASALFFGNMIGALSPCNSADSILSSGTFYATLFLGLAVIEALVITGRGSSFGKVSERILITSRILTFRSLFYQSVSWHESDGRNPNTLLSQLTVDADSLSAMSGTLIGISLSIIVNLSLGIIISHVIAWKIALVLLSTIPLLLASGYLRIRMLALFNEKHRQAFTHAVAVAKDAVDNFRLVTLFCLEEYSVKTYERSLAEPYNKTLRLIVFGNFWLALSYGMSSLIYAFAYWWGAYQVHQGAYTQVQFFIVLPALLISAQQCGQLFTLAPDISRAGMAAKHIFNQLDIGPPDTNVNVSDGALASNDGSLKSSKIHDVESSAYIIEPTSPAQNFLQHPNQGISVQFKDVYFSYPSRPNVRVLQRVTLEFPSNTLCALTGPSGAGKSTFFSLIEALYQPSKGQVFLNDNPISSLHESFRDEIAMLPQESMLFNASIRFNVTLGLPPGRTGSQEEVEEACRLANIHDTIAKLPDGYETIVGGIGSGLLSGGQKQRISLARALVRKPRLLLLDEATSALDSESEKIWQETLDGLMARQNQQRNRNMGEGELVQGMTVVSIAHRLSTVRKADRIFWIEGGRCGAWGTHEELYARCEGYRKSVDGQSLGG